MKQILLIFTCSFFLCNYVYCQGKINIEEVFNPNAEILKTSFVSEAKGFMLLKSGQVKKTIDSGRTWVNAGSIENELVILMPGFLLYDRVNDFKFINENVGFIITRFSVFKTIDGGQTWTLKTNTNDDIRLDLRGIEIKNNTIVVSIKGCSIGQTGDPNCILRNYLKSTDLGDTWAVISTNDFPSDYLKIEMKTETEWYANTYVYQSQIGIDFSKYIRKTVDGGVTWTNYYKDRSFENNIIDFAFKGDSMYVGGSAESYIDRGGGFSNQITMKFDDYSYNSKIELKDISFINSNILFAIANTTNYPTTITDGVSQSLVISKDKGKTWQLVDDLEFDNFTKKNYKQLEIVGKRVWIVSEDNKVYTFRYSNNSSSPCIPLTVGFERSFSYLVKGESLNLKLNLTGEFPIKYRLNNKYYIANSSPVIINFKPNRDTTFFVNYLKSSCGSTTDPGQVSYVTVYQSCETPIVSTSSSSTINAGQSTQIYVSVAGVPPISCKINGVVYNNIYVSSWLTVMPTSTTTYNVTEISNRCGAGTTEGSAIVTVNCSPLTKAILTGDAVVYPSDSIGLNVSFIGNPPYSFDLWETTIEGSRLYKHYSNILNQSFNFKVRPYDDYGNNFDLSNFKDACGNGDFDGYVNPQKTNCVKKAPVLSTINPTIYAGEGGATIDINFQNDLPIPFAIRFNNQTWYSYGNPYQYWVNPTTTTTYTLSSYYDKCVNRTINVNKDITITVLPSTCIKATAVLSGNQTINRGENANLSVNFTGTAPYDIVINDIGYDNILSSPFTLNVSPSTTTVYNITGVRNRCQFGTVSGSATVNVVVPNCNPISSKITGKQTINEGESANLNILSTGDLPYNMTINGVDYNNISNNSYNIIVTPVMTTTYTISKTNNLCGIGTTEGDAKVSVIYKINCPPTINFENGLQSGGNYAVSQSIESRAFSSNKLSYSAGKTISLLPGFETKNNVFFAKIEDCIATPVVPTNGLVLHLPFNADANDASGNNNNGIVFGTTLGNDRFGVANKAYRFNDGNSIIIPNSASLNLTNAFTFSVWVNMQSTTGRDGNGAISTNSQQCIFTKNCDYGQLRCTINPQPNGTFILQTYANDGDQATIPFQLNQWKLISLVYDGSILKQFVDGNLVSTKTTTLNLALTNNYDLVIGNMGCWVYYFNGFLDDFRMYNRALSNTEILDIYNAEKP